KLPRARIFTILRDPLQQVLSLYRYRRGPTGPDRHGFLRRYPHFDSFIEDPESQNRIAHSIGGEGATAEQCQDILLHDYVFCGVFEQMPVCLVMIGSLLGFDISGHMLHFNTAVPARRDVEDDIARYRDKVLALNAVDAAIYRFVHQRFHERLAHMPEYLQVDEPHVAHGWERQHAVGERNVRRLLAELDGRQQELAAAD